METIKKFLLNEALAQVTEEEDIDIKEKEIREIAGEGGPAMGGLGGDNIEPASPDANVIQEDVELEREAKLALTKDNTTLYGMTKAEARQILRDMGYSETGIKGIETYRQTRINSILKEEGMEFPGASRDQSLDNNMFDGTFYGADKENLGDLQHGFDPNNPEMGALNQQVKPYESEFNNDPQEVMAHGPKGYRNSLPDYNNRTSSGFAEESLKDGSGLDKKESIAITKLIQLAVAKGYSREAIKEMISVMTEEKWIQKATSKMKKKGTEGSETRAAHAAGESPMEYAHQYYHDKGKTGQKARFAVNAQKSKKECAGCDEDETVPPPTAKKKITDPAV